MKSKEIRLTATIPPTLLLTIETINPKTSANNKIKTGSASTSKRRRSRMMVPMVATPHRQAERRPKGRSASCSADARTNAPSQIAARMKKAIASRIKTTDTATSSERCAPNQLEICCGMALKSGALPFPPVDPIGCDVLELKLTPPPLSPAKRASSQRYLWRQVIANERVTSCQ